MRIVIKIKILTRSPSTANKARSKVRKSNGLPIFGHRTKLYARMLLRLLTSIILLAFAPARAQDLHFSQFYHNPLQLNPAATGIFSGDWRVAGLYRSQWASVPVDYRTFAAAFDTKFVRRGSTLISGGLLLARDQAGDAGLAWTQAGLTGSVAQALGENQAIALGVGLAFAQRSFDIEKLKFKNQWTGDVYNSALPTGEQFGASSGFVPTLSAGILWHYGPADRRTRLEAGLGAAHLNRPVVSFRDDLPATLPMRFSVLLNGIWQINDRLDLVGMGTAQQLGRAREIVVGGGLRRVLDSGAGNMTAVRFSLATRLGDAFIPAIQLERNNWTVGLSYDWNSSDFQAATRHRGGFEIAAVYRQVSVPPLQVFKSCPIF